MSLAFADWYFQQRIHRATTFLGVPVIKPVSDLWNYQELVCSLQPGLIVELGVLNGGFLRYLDWVCEAGSPETRILGIDITLRHIHPSVRDCSRVVLHEADSTSDSARQAIRSLWERTPGPMLVSIDSDHHAEHVFTELWMLRSLTQEGDYVVVEDTNISSTTRPKYGPGPAEGLAQYLELHPGDYEVDVERENKFGFTYAPGGWLKRR